MKLSYLGTMAVLSLILQGCSKSPAEKDYLQLCSREMTADMCSCSYELLENAHGEDAINAMYEAKEMTPRFKRDMAESLLYCRDMYRKDY